MSEIINEITTICESEFEYEEVRKQSTIKMIEEVFAKNPELEVIRLIGLVIPEWGDHKSYHIALNGWLSPNECYDEEGELLEDGQEEYSYFDIVDLTLLQHTAVEELMAIKKDHSCGESFVFSCYKGGVSV